LDLKLNLKLKVFLDLKEFLKRNFFILEVTDHSVDELQLVDIERPIFFNDTQEV